MMMETSTPMPSDLRRRTLLMNMANTSSPVRRSLNTSLLNNSVIERANDEDERADRRSQLEQQKRLSVILTPRAVNLNESFIKEQFAVYTHLFTENKITTKNAWKLQIIDMLRPLCEKSRQDVLQVASTSIDISAKVYGIRVDDLHSEGLKLANNMARTAETVAAPENDEDDSGEEQENAPSKKKKRKRTHQTGVKSTINKNPKGNLGKLSKLEPADFTTRVNADSGTIDNLFTNVLKETPTTFILLDKTKKIIEESDPVVQNDDKVSFSKIRLPEKLNSLNMHLNDFVVDLWDPEQEEKQLNAEKSLLSQIQPVVFDDHGFPIPELDGSIHDIFETNDVNDIDDNDDDIQITDIRLANTITGDLRGGVARIVDFRPTESTVHSSEYSFNPVITTSDGKYLDQIWAGPSHWKLKIIKGSVPRFSGQATIAKQSHKGRKKSEKDRVDWDTEPVEIEKMKKLVIKKKPPLIDIDKITLPLMDQSCARIMTSIKELMLKPGVCPVEKKDQSNGEGQDDLDVGPYKYENPNDSLYCSQSQPQDDGDNGDFDDNMDCDEEHIIQHAGNLADNLVDNPEMVANNYIQFASKAKQIDMKKLKSAIWHKLTNTEVPQEQSKVIPQNFSDLYKELPALMPSKEKDKLSCPLAFFALLHLANEQNLYLKQLQGNQDCYILGPDYYI